MEENSIRLANWLNFLVASSAFLVGIYYLFRHSLLKEHKFLKGILAFWLGQWLVFATTWAFIIK